MDSKTNAKGNAQNVENAFCAIGGFFVDYFKNFVSNTTAASGNQLIFKMEKDEVRTARVFYKIFAGGKYNYSLLFSNIIDSTHNKGEVSCPNMICDPWTIHSARIGKCRSITREKALPDMIVSDCGAGDINVEGMKDVTFGGCASKYVAPGEFFTTDPVEMEFEKNEFLCLELTFSGRALPYHEEGLLPVYVKEGEEWKYSRLMPLPGMVGCDRKVKKTIGFWGDSITQGVGTEYNSYDHWVAKLAELLGEDYAVWDLGIGYARGKDAATLGAWYYKAKHCDVVGMAFGVNDVFHEFDSGVQIGQNIEKLVHWLHGEGVKVMLQTAPPFGFVEPERSRWYELNDYLKETVAQKADGFFVNTGFLGVEGEYHKTVYGGHPNSEGCTVWANNFYPVMKEFLESL